MNLELPQRVENKGESDHVVEILENVEVVERLEIPSVKRTPFRTGPLSAPEYGNK